MKTYETKHASLICEISDFISYCVEIRVWHAFYYATNGVVCVQGKNYQIQEDMLVHIYGDNFVLDVVVSVQTEDGVITDVTCEWDVKDEVGVDVIDRLIEISNFFEAEATVEAA